MSWRSYFEKTLERDKDLPVLKPRSAKCSDCPSKCMYGEIVVALRQEPFEFRKRISEKWFCHTSPNRACRGNWDYQFKRLTREVAPNEATSHPSALRVNEYTGMKKDTPVTDW